MVFSSSLFMFAFLPITLILYFVCPFKLRNLVLFAVSLVFYGWGEPVYVFLMLASIAMDYLFGVLITKNRGNGMARRYLIMSVVMNLGVLFFFKYLDFFIDNLRFLPSLENVEPLGITLPIGISFYTFQKMSYVIDVYRGDGRTQRNFISFGAYITMFPQLIAGPIVKYKDIDRQLTDRSVTTDGFADGVCVFLIGLSKKLLLANTIGQLWDTMSAAPGMSVLGAWLGIAAFTFQIYFDFSGYSDMAVGLGKMLGFDFMRNFNYPYVAKSVTEFWRRWHISLSTWFREYMYIPLGGNRRGLRRQILNLLIVWLATGIWHGASWNFVIWGLYYAFLLIIEKLFLLKLLEKTPGLLRHAYTLLAVVIGWALFAPGTLGDAMKLISAMFGVGAGGLAGATDMYYLGSYLPLFAVLILSCLPAWAKWYSSRGEKARNALALPLVIVSLLLCTMSMIDSTYNPFLYFRF